MTKIKNLSSGVELLAVCTLIWSVAGVAAGEPSKPAEGPEEKLIALANAGRLDALLPAYIDLQWLRLKGDAASPKPEPSAPPAKYQVFADFAHKAGLRGLPPMKPLSPAEIEQLESIFKKRPRFRDRFLLALDGAVDRMPEAARIALKLFEKYPRESENFEDLVIAFAAVWDDPILVNVENRCCVPELCNSILDKRGVYTQEVGSYEDSFAWYTKNANRMCPWFKIMPWRLLVYLVDEYNQPSDRDWVLDKHKFKPDLGTVYSTIVYDRGKLSGPGKIAGKPYSLPNLLEYGGVCRDQAYYARAVCRSYGMPAYMATGEGTNGGGHAWVGWITHDGRAFKLTSHGRYVQHNYYTAAIIDPKSGRYILDYLVDLEAMGMNNEAGYDQAETYYRVYREFGDKLSDKTRTNLVVGAVRKNAYHRLAWLAVQEALAKGDLPQSLASQQWDYLVSQFNEVPDFTFSMIRPFSKMFKTSAERKGFYNAAAKVFEKLKRPDLVNQLREDEKKAEGE
ncbi:MAG: transglutaminase domain-containing protein [Planctomycetota bacterium]|nr:transglutaminase domain-containing protein [Planctomycetota bacterium]